MTSLFPSLPRSVRVVIPLYNEEETLPFLAYRLVGVHRILRDETELGFILVNDGSTDRTAELLRDSFRDLPFVTTIEHARNGGFGAALRTGIGAALATNTEAIVTIDADTNYDHFLIPLLLSALKPGVDVVTASPWHPEGGRKFFPKHRLALSLGLSWLYRRAIGPGYPPLHCYSAGFRVYRRRVLEAVEFTGTDYLATAEIMARAILQGFTIHEYPVHVSPRWYGASKMQIFRQIRAHLKFLSRMRSRGRLRMRGDGARS